MQNVNKQWGHTNDIFGGASEAIRSGLDYNVWYVHARLLKGHHHGDDL